MLHTLPTPIETRYAGCRFRSRLEARWAVFFDVLKIPWRYEPEGFAVRHGQWYLPDFYLQHIGYVEIKPSAAHARDEELWRSLGEILHPSGIEVYCLYGDIPAPTEWETSVREFGIPFPRDYGAWDALDVDAEYWWAECPHCHRIGIAYGGRYPRLRCCAQCRNDPDRSWNGNMARFMVAAVAARSARF